MQRKKLVKLTIVTLAIIFTTLITTGGTVQAVLQANPTTNATPKKLMGLNWIAKVREMEASGGAMGLTETVDSSTQLGSSTNGIDVHMMKSTEYGAMAILSASGFGNPANTTTIDTTTGNKTGVYMQIVTQEWVAGSGGEATGMMSPIANRYFNTYIPGQSSSAKAGDAMNLRWHQPTAYTFINQDNGGVYRGGPSGVFGYSWAVINNTKNYHASRAVVVSGTGF